MEKLRLELKENNKRGIKRRAVTSAHTQNLCNHLSKIPLPQVYSPISKEGPIVFQTIVTCQLRHFPKLSKGAMSDSN